MLKYFYKTFLISFLCGSLLMIDMSYKANTISVGMNVARAESVSTGGVSDSNLMSTLTMVGISVIASRLILYGKITTDIALAAAGGLAFIAGDMAATSKLKEAKKKIETEIQRGKSGDITDEQRQSLIRLLNMYKASKDAATTKKNLQMAAAAAFAAAAVAAYMSSAMELTQHTLCYTAMSAGVAAGTSPLAAAYEVSCYGCGVGTSAKVACDGEAQSLAASFQAYTAEREVPAPSCASITSIFSTRTTEATANKALPTGCTVVAAGTATAIPTCESMFVGDQMNEPTMCVSPVILLATTAATVAMMGINASTIVTAIVGFAAPLAEMVDMAIATPKRRAVVWGVLAGLAFASSSATGNVISQIEGDIKKIQTLLDTINLQANSVTASNAVQKSTSITTSVNANDIIKSDTDSFKADVPLATGSKLPCVTSAESGASCPSLSSTLANSSGFNNLPEGFKADVMSIGKMADGLNGASTISASTLNSASNLGSNATRILNELKKAKTDYQAKLIATKSKSNVDEDEKAFKAKLDASFKDMMKKNKTNTSALLAAYGSSSGNSDLAKTAEDTNKKLGSKFTASIGKFTAPNFNVSPTTGGKLVSTPDTSVDTEAAKLKAEREALVKASNIDDYELKTDINRDKTDSIFDQISTRYKKSGYPRLFKRLNE